MNLFAFLTMSNQIHKHQESLSSGQATNVLSWSVKIPLTFESTSFWGHAVLDPRYKELPTFDGFRCNDSKSQRLSMRWNSMKPMEFHKGMTLESSRNELSRFKDFFPCKWYQVAAFCRLPFSVQKLRYILTDMTDSLPIPCIQTLVSSCLSPEVPASILLPTRGKRIHSELSAAQLFSAGVSGWSLLKTIAEIKLSSFCCWFCHGKIGKNMEFIRSHHGWSYDIFWCLILFNTNPYSPMCFCAHLIHWKLRFFTSPLPKSLICVGLMTLVGPRQFGGWIQKGLQLLQFAESFGMIKWHESSRFQNNSLEAIGFHWSILFDVPNDHP